MTYRRLFSLTLLLGLTASTFVFGQGNSVYGQRLPSTNTPQATLMFQDVSPSKGLPPAATVTETPAAPHNGQVISSQPISPYSAYPLNGCGSNGCGSGCGRKECNIQCLIPWTCDDLKMEPNEPTCRSCCHGGFLKGLLWCPDEEEDGCDSCNGNGNGDTVIWLDENGKEIKKTNGNGKNGNGNGTNGNGSNGNGNGEAEEEEEEEEEEETKLPLMAMLDCVFPNAGHRHHRHQNCFDGCNESEPNTINIYGWTQQGYTGNFDSPRDRLNFGVNYNNRSNDWLFNQQYIVIERAVQQNDTINWGFRFDVYGGHDAPKNTSIQIGWFDRVNPNPPDTNDYGIDIPQMYGEVHLPWITEGGVDVQAGWMYTRMGNELIPAPDTDFYSHQYEFFYAIPFYHAGVHAIFHVTDTIDVMHAVVRGWDSFFDDANGAVSYHGYTSWNSCDEKKSLTVSYITGPEQVDNNGRYRTMLTAYYSHIFGRCDQWRFVGGGNMAWDALGAGDNQDAEWYGCTGYLFYTIDPRVRLGMRGEWFRDDDGVRTGFAANFYEVTWGITWRPFQNFRIRPEFRCDWCDGAVPYNDGTDTFQATAACDCIWEF